MQALQQDWQITVLIGLGAPTPVTKHMELRIKHHAPGGDKTNLEVRHDLP
jgi:hypothetical protein